MGNFVTNRESFVNVTRDGKTVRLLKKEVIERFNTGILGLGDISANSKAISAVAAVFDLEGFTKFCGQIDPQLSVPNYLNKFLSWLMEQIKKETINSESDEGVLLWHPLPFLTKYTGDGLLILWDSSTMSATSLANLIISLLNICRNYPAQLLSQVKHSIVSPPLALRCGIARGTVYSVGEDADYVGSCINMAARIQKLPGLSFAFNCRGFDLSYPKEPQPLDTFCDVKKVSIRGINEEELVAVLKNDLTVMSDEDKKLYRKP